MNQERLRGRIVRRSGNPLKVSYEYPPGSGRKFSSEVFSVETGGWKNGAEVTFIPATLESGKTIALDLRPAEQDLHENSYVELPMQIIRGRRVTLRLVILSPEETAAKGQQLAKLMANHLLRTRSRI
ncbi:MAG TPA: hypothetical protein VEA59_04965 [Patescibacteria group bacterium]|nr:hypothetical protein [Patescibacteria group bacterium]